MENYRVSQKPLGKLQNFLSIFVSEVFIRVFSYKRFFTVYKKAKTRNQISENWKSGLRKQKLENWNPEQLKPEKQKLEKGKPEKWKQEKQKPEKQKLKKPKME